MLSESEKKFYLDKIQKNISKDNIGDLSDSSFEQEPMQRPEISINGISPV